MQQQSTVHVHPISTRVSFLVFRMPKRRGKKKVKGRELTLIERGEIWGLAETGRSV